MSALTFTEFEAQAGARLGRRPFGACSSRHLLQDARMLRDAADDAEMVATMISDRAPAPSDLAAQLAHSLGLVLLQVAALANEIGTPMESLVTAALQARAARAKDRCTTAAQLAAERARIALTTARIEAGKC